MGVLLGYFGPDGTLGPYWGLSGFLLKCCWVLLGPWGLSGVLLGPVGLLGSCWVLLGHCGLIGSC